MLHIKSVVIDIESSLSKIPKEEVIKLIKTQGSKNPYYFEGLSYKVANIDKDNDFEIVVKIDGGVHSALRHSRYFLKAHY